MSAHGISPYRTALELVTARRTSPVQSVTYKQNAAGSWLCDTLTMHQRDEEDDSAFLGRSERNRATVAANLAGAAVSPQDAPEPSAKEKSALAIAELAAPRRKAPVAS
jgi:hypothetical protein